MQPTEDEIKAELTDAFWNPIASCTYIRNFVLRVEFERTADLSTFLGLSATANEFAGHREVRANEGFQKNSVLFGLSQRVPVVVLENASILKDGRRRLTAGASEHFTLSQDPFHVDGWSGVPDFAGIFVKKPHLERATPTFYATKPAVQKALSADNFTLDLPREVIEVIKRMAQPDYKFSFSGAGEKQDRRTLGQLYEEFTAEVYEAIPDSDKYEQRWTKGHRVVMHSNDGRVLHARPASNLDSHNCVRALALFPE